MSTKTFSVCRVPGEKGRGWRAPCAGWQRGGSEEERRRIAFETTDLILTTQGTRSPTQRGKKAEVRVGFVERKGEGRRRRQPAVLSFSCRLPFVVEDIDCAFGVFLDSIEPCYWRTGQDRGESVQTLFSRMCSGVQWCAENGVDLSTSVVSL